MIEIVKIQLKMEAEAHLSVLTSLKTHRSFVKLYPNPHLDLDPHKEKQLDPTALLNGGTVSIIEHLFYLVVYFSPCYV